LLEYAKSEWKYDPFERSYRISSLMHGKRLFTRSYLHQRLVKSAAFAEEKDAAVALDKAIEYYITTEAVAVTDLKAVVGNSRGAKTYTIINMTNLERG
jgi:hypothetical protein